MEIRIKLGLGNNLDNSLSTVCNYMADAIASGVGGLITTSLFAGRSIYLLGVLMPSGFTPLTGAVVGAVASVVYNLSKEIFAIALKEKNKGEDLELISSVLGGVTAFAATILMAPGAVAPAVMINLAVLASTVAYKHLPEILDAGITFGGLVVLGALKLVEKAIDKNNLIEMFNICLASVVGVVASRLLVDRSLYVVGTLVAGGATVLPSFFIGVTVLAVGRIFSAILGLPDTLKECRSKVDGLLKVVGYGLGFAAATFILPGMLSSVMTIGALAVLSDAMLSNISLDNLVDVAEEAVKRLLHNVTFNNTFVRGIYTAVAAGIGACATYLLAGKSVMGLGVLVAAGIPIKAVFAVGASAIIISRLWNTAFGIPHNGFCMTGSGFRQRFDIVSELTRLAGYGVAFAATTYILPGMMGTVLLINAIALASDFLLANLQSINIQFGSKNFGSRVNDDYDYRKKTSHRSYYNSEHDSRESDDD